MAAPSVMPVQTQNMTGLFRLFSVMCQIVFMLLKQTGLPIPKQLNDLTSIRLKTGHRYALLMRDCFSGFTENEVRWNPGYPYHVSSRRTAVSRVYLLFSANVPEDEFILTRHVLNRRALTGMGSR